MFFALWRGCVLLLLILKQQILKIYLQVLDLVIRQMYRRLKDLHVEVEAAFPVIIKVFNPNGTLVAQTVGNTCYVTLNQGAYEVAVFSMDGTHLTSRKVLLNGYSYILIEL